MVYVTSEGNYVSFFIKNKEDNSLKEKVLRGKLISVEKELASFSQIIRCHKSFIINTKLVKNLSGNARGFFLHFDEIEEDIPVSRKFSRAELEKLLPI